MRSILIVDDDPSIRASLELLLKQHGYGSLSASSPDEAIALLAKRSFDLVLQDMNFSRGTSGVEGLDLVARIRVSHKDLPVILITAWGSISLAVQGVKAGASDFITKPWTNAQLLSAIETALGVAAARAERRKVPTRAELDERLDLAGLVGSDSALLEVLDVVGRVAPTDASVLILGESGTGKELVAEAIHRNSKRRDGPFVKVNLGGISSTLFESEMFGHVRGAFTDAKETRRGRFETADGGTIFLDEVGEVDLSSQVKLLRVLQDRSYEVLGSSRSRTVDVRVVSATNRTLDEMVRSGEFREDLLYRLNLITLQLPPLRERRSDIARLAGHFLSACAAAYRRGPLQLTPRAVEWLAAQSWPGNIRQLRQLLERAVLIHDGELLDAKELAAVADIGKPRSGELPAPGSMTLEEMERAMIVRCMAHYDGNITRVAEALGLSRAALYRRLEKFGLGEAQP